MEEQNPNSLYHLFQNPNSLSQIPNFLYQNSSQNKLYPTMQNHQQRNILAEMGLHVNPHDHQHLNIRSWESGLNLNPSFIDGIHGQEISLEASLSRLNLSTAPPLQSQFLNGNNLFHDSSVDMDFRHLSSYSQEQRVTNDLRRLRIDSAVTGHMGLHNGIPSMDGLSGNLSLQPRSRSTSFADYLYGNGGRTPNLVAAAALNRSAASLNNSSNEFRLQRRSQSSDELYAARGNLNPNWIRGPSVSGLEISENSYILLSNSLYNHGIRPRKSSYHYSLVHYSLEEVIGRVVSVAKDQQGSRFLQQKLKERIEEEIEMIFSEVKDHLDELMVHPCATYVIQKLFETCSEEQMTELISMIIPKLMSICLEEHGSRAVQEMITHLKTREQISLLVSGLKPITINLCKNITEHGHLVIRSKDNDFKEQGNHVRSKDMDNDFKGQGHHVIILCLTEFFNEETKPLQEEIASNCLELATDKTGCFVLQKFIRNTKGALREHLINEITANALFLSKHQFGNYVVQCILELNNPHFTADIIQRLEGNYVPMSMNKFGSHVVEKCFKNIIVKEHSRRIIKEIILSPNFLKLVQDEYGNFVIQSALNVSEELMHRDLHHTLASCIMMNYAFLHSHPYGKRVLARARGCIRACRVSH